MSQQELHPIPGIQLQLMQACASSELLTSWLPQPPPHPKILISALQRSPATKACLWTRIPCGSAVHPPLMPALTCSNSVTPCVLFTCRCTAEVPGYKGLLVDKDTMRVCSTLFGRTELAEHSVVHVERLDSTDGTKHPELKVGCSRLHHSTSQHITI